MKKTWSKPLIEIITKDELDDLITAAGCSTYHIICDTGHWTR